MSLKLGIEQRSLQEWLAHTAEISLQNPWFYAAQYPGRIMDVEVVDGTLVEVVRGVKSDGTPYQFIYRPDLVPSIEAVIDRLNLDPDHLGYAFCPAGKVPPQLDHLPKTPCVQLYQLTADFDPTLSGKEGRHLRQNLSRAERQYGLEFQEGAQYDEDALGGLIYCHLMDKHPGTDPEKLLYWSERTLLSMKHVAENPFGKLYIVKNNEEVRAVAAVLEMGAFASVERIASYRDVDRAQEYLETNMWRSFCANGVERVCRGVKTKQGDGLLEYKEKFAPLHERVWLSANPCARPGDA